MALAGLFSLNICILNLSEKWLTDDVFNQLLCNSPQDSLFLLEDVDAAFINRDHRDRNSRPLEANSKWGGHLRKLTFQFGFNTLL